MQDKTKTNIDRQEIKRIFAVAPIDWARYPDGTLVFISPTGQKFKYSQRMLDVLSKDIADSKAAAKKAAAKKASAKKAAAKSKKESPSKPYSQSDVAPGAAAK